MAKKKIVTEEAAPQAEVVAPKATKPCPDCNATGLQGEALCATCSGHGKI